MKKKGCTQAIAEKVDKRKGVKVEESDAEAPAKTTGMEGRVDELNSDDEGLDEDEVWKVRFAPKR